MALKITKEQIEESINNSESMASAAAKLGVHMNTFKRHAKKHGLYNPNQGLKGSKKPQCGNHAYPLEDILAGKHPQYSTYKLKNKLLAAKMIENKCSSCGIREWNGKPLNMELDHINGDRTYHIFYNLRMLCPNCHSQTDTHTSKNRGRYSTNNP